MAPFGHRIVRSADFGDNNHNGVPDRLDFVRAGSSTSARAALRPYGVFGNASIAILDHGGSSIYHSLQSQIVSHFGRGSQFQASYTFSRTIGDVTLIGGENSLGASSVSLLEDRSLDRGLAFTHRTHVLNASLVLVLPTLEDKTGFVKNVVGGWEIGTIAQASSGRPVTVFTGAIPGLTNRVSGTGLTANQRPNVVAGQDGHASGGLPEQILNPAAWTLVNFQLGTFGNSGRGVCTGPNFRQVDLAFYKNVRVSRTGEGPVAVRDLQRLQPRQLHHREHDKRDPRHRPRGHRLHHHRLHAVGQLRAGHGDA